MIYLYSVEVEWLKDREGEARADGIPNLSVGAPPEFKGRDGVWSPEHLFVASLESCFMLTFLAVAEASKLEFVSFRSSAKGRLEKIDKYQITEVTLKPLLVLRSRDDSEKALRVLEKAERNCFISNSIKAAIKIEPEITVAE